MKRFLASFLLLPLLLTAFPFCVAGQDTTADSKPKEGKDIAIEEGKLYSFMNCDTGRLISLAGTDEFRLFRAEGKNEWFLRDAEAKKYLSLDSGKAEWSDVPVSVTLYLDNDYARVQLRVSGGAFVLADDDGGETAEASLALRPSDDTYIETGWYLTKHGDALPVRVAMVGDSITNGCCPDGDLPKAGCRAKLSEELIKKYGRVVFVGSAVASHGADGSGGEKSHLDEPFLYREEGHNGWVVESQEGYAPANNYSILSVRENLQKKYQPDVICMMLGINDIGQLGMDSVIADFLGIGTAFFGRWENLVRLMLADLPENGRLIIGSLTPFGAGPLGSGEKWDNGTNLMLEKINPMFKARVDSLAEEDARISFTDNYAFVHQVGPSAISSDGIHLSAAGYSAMADSYLDALNKVMDQVARREEGEDKWPAEPKAKSPALRWILPVIALLIGGGAWVSITKLRKQKKKNQKAN